MIPIDSCTKTLPMFDICPHEHNANITVPKDYKASKLRVHDKHNERRQSIFRTGMHGAPSSLIIIPNRGMCWPKLHHGESVRVKAQALVCACLPQNVRKHNAVKVLMNNASWQSLVAESRMLLR